MSTAVTAPTLRPTTGAITRRAVVLLSLLLVAATTYGGVRVATGASRGAVTDDLPSLTVGHATFRVTHVERVNGLTNADLSGMGHGIQGLVLDDSTMIRVSVTVTAGGKPTPFDASRLRLVRAGGKTQVPLGGSVGRGTLRPRASVEGAVAFVVPRDGARLRLGAVGTGAQIALVKIDDAPPGAGHMDMSMPGTGASTTPAPHHHDGRK
ncbi:MAG: hypothetical protein JWR20_333 [Marmoricola sp.]|nr:hypothetical protein [Marmoricola sp.]